MRGLQAHDLLDVWDAGRGRSPFDRALLLLAAGDPARARADVRALAVGERERLLLELRERTFGGDLRVFDACPACRGPLELTLHATALRAVPAGELTGELAWDGGTARLRAPTIGDLEDAIRAGPSGAYRALFDACVEARDEDGGALEAGALPEDLRVKIAERLAELDPAAETLLNFICPSCAHAWQRSFDVTAFLWTEISAYAKRLLGEVDALAAAYGWHEEAILRMSATRRRAYLELVAERRP